MHQKQKKNFIAEVFLFAIIACYSGSLFAQKSSGVVPSDSNVQTDISASIPPSINKEIRDDVTRGASASASEVRFLLRPKKEAIISSRMSGEISKIQFDIGERFNKGDVLISLQCGEQNARLQAQRAKVNEYTFTYKSNLDLLAGNAVSRYEVDIAKSQLTHQRALLSEANIMASLCKVKAPFSGGIVSVDVNAHEAVSSGTALIKIIDDSEIVMSLNVPSTWINKVEKGNFFTIVVDETSGNYKAKVTGVSPAIDPVSKTIELRAILTERFAELRPGMSGRAKLNFSKN